MAPDAKRELQVRMSVVADTQGATQSVQRLAAEFEKVAKAIDGVRQALGAGPAAGGGAAGTAAAAKNQPLIAGPGGARLALGLGGGGAAGKDTMADRMNSLRNLQLGGVAGRYEQFKAFGEAAKDLGIPGGGLLSRAAMPLAAGIGVANFAGTAMSAMSDENLDGLGAARAVFRSLPFGETLQDAYDNFSGRKLQFEMAQTGHQQRMARQQGRLDLAGFNLSNNPQQAALEARARGMAGASPILEGYADRSTAEGEKAFRDRQRMLPLERESAKLEREAAVASAQRTAANKELQGIERRQNELVRERKKLEDEVENTSGAAKQRALYRLSENEQETKAQAGLRRQAEQQSAEAARQAAQARANAQMVGVRKLQAEAAGLEEDAAQSAGGARRLGMMNRFQRARAVQDLELLQQYGPEAIGQSRLQNALSIAPETAGKIVEKAGAGTAEFARLGEIASADFRGDPEKLRKEAAAKRDEAARRELEVEATLARASAEAGRDLGKVMAEQVNRVVEAAIGEIKTQLRLGKNAK